MPGILIHPPKTILEVWKSLPEGTLCQLINNKLIMSPAPAIIHQQILNEINMGISFFLKINPLGKILIAPVDIHFSKQNILQPDLVFVKNENLDIIKSKGVFGSPDIIIEVLSPSTSQLDFEEKKWVYERFGVQEYFIVDPQSKTVYAWFLNNKEYDEQQPVEGKIKSIMLNTEIAF